MGEVRNKICQDSRVPDTRTKVNIQTVGIDLPFEYIFHDSLRERWLENFLNSRKMEACNCGTYLNALWK